MIVHINNKILKIWLDDIKTPIFEWRRYSTKNLKMEVITNVIYIILVLSLLWWIKINIKKARIDSNACTGETANPLILIICKGPLYGIPEQQPTTQHAILEILYIKGKEIMEYFMNFWLPEAILSKMMDAMIMPRKPP